MDKTTVQGSFGDRSPSFLSEADNTDGKAGAKLLAEYLDKKKKEVADKAADTTKEIIQLDSLGPDQRQQVAQINDLQKMIIQSLGAFPFKSTEERKQFIDRLMMELAKDGPSKDGSDFEKLPEFGPATKEGFKRLVELQTNLLVPGKLEELRKFDVAIPPGPDLQIAGSDKSVFKNTEQFLQELSVGKGSFGIKTDSLQDVGKLARINEWVDKADASLNTARIDRLESLLSDKLEQGINEGKYPATWRRPKEMDKEAWCAAFETTVSTYDNATRVADALHHMVKSNKGFSTDAFDHLPNGMKAVADPKTGNLTVDFRPLLIDNLQPESAENRPKIEALQAWTDKYYQQAMKVGEEFAKDVTKIASFGEVEIPNGWVNPKTGEFQQGGVPSEGSQPFNLIDFDFKISEKRDKFNQVSGIEVTTDTTFQKVPPIGYLNTMGQEVYRTPGKPKMYDPEDYVAVQTGMSQVELVKAKDLQSWKALQELKHYGSKGITLAMDAAMVASGGINVLAARQAMRMGAREAVTLGARALGKEAAVEIPQQLLKDQIKKGAFQMVLGGTGIFHNAGGDEVPGLKAITTARSAYFLTHAGWEVAKMTRLPNLVNGMLGLGEGAKAAKAAQATEQLAELAKTGALEKLGAGLRGADKVATGTFAVADKAFLAQFLWSTAEMGSHYAKHERPESIARALTSLTKAAQGDSGAARSVYENGLVKSESVDNHFKRLVATQGALSEQDSKAIQEIEQKVKELSDPKTSKEARQEYVNGLLKNFYYAGAQIAQKQNDRMEEWSEDELKKQSASDSQLASQAVKNASALAIALLAKDESGNWPEVIAKRTQHIDSYKKLHVDQEGHTYKTQEGNVDVTQQLTSKEVIEMLNQELMKSKDLGERKERAAALTDLGLVSGEHYGSLLIAALKDKNTSEADQLKALGELGGVINNLRLEEDARKSRFGQSDYLSRGLAAGVTSEDLIRQLKEATAGSNSEKVRATGTFVSNFLNQSELDEKNIQRFKEVFEGDQKGITKETLKKWLDADLSSTETTRASNERKVLAAQTQLKEALAAHDDKTITASANVLFRSLNSNDAKTVSSALSALTADKNQLLKELNKAQPTEKPSWSQKLSTQTINILTEHPDDTKAAPSDRYDSARLRLQTIDLAVDLSRNDSDPKHRLLVSQLKGLASKEHFMEVRASAINALSKVATAGDADVISLLTKQANSKTEPNEVVRAASIEALESLVASNKELKAILGPLATSEPNAATRERLEKYYKPQGIIEDSKSQLSKQTIENYRILQNRSDVIPEDINTSLKNHPDFKRLLAKEDTLSYIDPDREAVDTWTGKVRLDSIWDYAVDQCQSSEDWKRGMGTSHLLKREMQAQSIAFDRYKERIDRLAKVAKEGNTAPGTVKIGDKSFSEREAAVLYLGNLMSGPSQMGKPFYMHRNKIERNAQGLDYAPFTGAQQQGRHDASHQEYHVFSSDPWPDAQFKMALELKQLCSKNDGQIGSDVMYTAVMNGLESKNTSDSSKTVLLQGLDSLLSQPNTTPAKKREILSQLSNNVLKNMQHTDKYAGTAIGVLNMLDKYGPTVFEPFSREWSDIRCAIESHSKIDTKAFGSASFNTPAEVAIRAREILDRDFYSNRDAGENVRTTKVSADNYAAALTDLGTSLRQAGTTDGSDERTKDAVDLIYRAGKEPFKGGDKRIDALENLLTNEYPDQVRLAAAQVLKRPDVLLDLSINADGSATRLDAVDAIKKSSLDDLATWPAQQDILAKPTAKLRTALAAALGKSEESLTGDLIQQSRDFIAANAASKDADLNVARANLQTQLFRLGDAQAAMGMYLSRAITPEALKEADTMMKSALTAWGIDDKAISGLDDGLKKTELNVNSQDLEFNCWQLLQKLKTSHADQADLPLIERTLARYGRMHSIISNTDDDQKRAVACLAMSKAVAGACYDRVSQQYCDAMTEVGASMQHMGWQYIYTNPKNGRDIGAAWLWQSYSLKKQTLRGLLTDQKEQHPNDPDLQKRIDDMKDSIGSTGVERLLYETEKYSAFNGNSEYKKYIQILSSTVEHDLKDVKANDSVKYNRTRFLKAFADTRFSEGAQKQEAVREAEGFLEGALSGVTAGDSYDADYIKTVVRAAEMYELSGQQDTADALLLKEIDRNEKLFNERQKQALLDYNSRKRSTKKAA